MLHACQQKSRLGVRQNAAPDIDKVLCPQSKLSLFQARFTEDRTLRPHVPEQPIPPSRLSCCQDGFKSGANERDHLVKAAESKTQRLASR
jgi:hypothetical protein